MPSLVVLYSVIVVPLYPKGGEKLAAPPVK